MPSFNLLVRALLSVRSSKARPLIWLLIDSSGVGGAERHVSMLAESLIRRGLRVTIVLYGDHGHNPWLDQIVAARVPHLLLDNTVASLIKMTHRERPQLIHTHGYKAGILGRIGGRLAGIPTVSTFHSGLRGRGRVYLYDLIDEWTSFLGARIAVSAAIQQRLPFSSTLIPSFVQVPSNSMGGGGLPRRVGFVGRLSEEKGPDVFCEIAACSPPGLEWHVFGSGPMRAGLEERFGPHVRFHGSVVDLSGVWPSLGLLLMPSRSEGLPLAALEALAHGVPVLASRVGALPSVVIAGVTGWLFESGCVAEAREAVCRWQSCNSEQQSMLRQQCRTHVRTHFSEQQWVPPVIDIYRQTGLPVPAAPFANDLDQ